VKLKEKYFFFFLRLFIALLSFAILIAFTVIPVALLLTIFFYQDDYWFTTSWQAWKINDVGNAVAVGVIGLVGLVLGTVVIQIVYNWNMEFNSKMLTPNMSDSNAIVFRH